MTRVEHILRALNLKYKTRGKRAWALCPYHEDHKPSWFIRLQGHRSGQHHCFSCKQGGTLIELVMRMRACEAKEARAFIVDGGKGYEPPRLRARVVERPAILGRVRFTLPKEVILEPLLEWGSLPRRYAEKRGITPDQVSKFGLGYAVDGRLGGRIVLPARTTGEHPANYSARSFTDEEPKYLTPHESEGADLGALFGEHLWPPPFRRDVIVVTEGAIDALAVDRARRLPVGSFGGSEIHPMQAVKLTTFGLVIGLTDNDPAGDKAARQLSGMLGRHTAFERVLLPEGKDAATMKRDDLAAYLDLVLSRAGA